MTTIFAKIIRGELPCKKVFENEHVIAFEDIAPAAPVHILIVSKKPVENIQSLEEKDFYLVSEIVRVAQILADRLGIAEGYRLVTNSGIEAGQTVFHLHFHLLGGRHLSSLC